MGRVAWHWRAELERRGHRFTELGRAPLGREAHPAIYPWIARWAANSVVPPPDLVLAHEPSAACFAASKWPTVSFSHGLERRGWMALLKYNEQSHERISLRSRLLYPYWRLAPSDYGNRRAAGMLVLNSEDYEYCLRNYGRSAENTFLFRNGVNLRSGYERSHPVDAPTVLFLGSWLARKGTSTLTQAAGILHGRGLAVNWLLAGTGVRSDEVLSSWSPQSRANVEVVPEFSAGEERDLMRRAHIFVLPSFFEGQPLSLLQAMAEGLPAITSDTLRLPIPSNTYSSFTLLLLKVPSP